ncbi:hypothetical protein COCNU_scaffold002830G000010 [Cocos nucifera]|nr:hypothetical protein [Cocos nucifera]
MGNERGELIFHAEVERQGKVFNCTPYEKLRSGSNGRRWAQVLGGTPGETGGAVERIQIKRIQMDPSMEKKLKKLSARRLRSKISSAQPQAFGSFTIRVSDAVPSVAPPLVLANIRGYEPLPSGDTQNPMEDAEVEPMASVMNVIDIAVVLMRSIEENTQLLDINKALEAEIEKLKARFASVDESEVEALKMAEEKMAMLMCAMEARAEVAVSKAFARAIDNFWASKEFKNEKALFALDAYDEGKHVI